MRRDECRLDLKMMARRMLIKVRILMKVYHDFKLNFSECISVLFHIVYRVYPNDYVSTSAIRRTKTKNEKHANSEPPHVGIVNIILK